MVITRVVAVFFSATGTTEKIVRTVADSAAKALGVTMVSRDFTLPAARQTPLKFCPEELVILGTPVYAGRVPNVLLPYLRTLCGAGAVGVPIVVYGNRDFDDALLEAKDLLEAGGVTVAAAGAFIGEHSFSRTLAGGRPDEKDLRLAGEFGRRIADRLLAVSDRKDLGRVTVPGIPVPDRGYYWPRDRQGRPVDIRKVKPQVSPACNHCGLCARICPMGSIDPEEVSRYTGICIKCGACVKKCPQGARYYDDAGYLYHQRELEAGFARRAEPALFF